MRITRVKKGGRGEGDKEEKRVGKKIAHYLFILEYFPLREKKGEAEIQLSNQKKNKTA